MNGTIIIRRSPIVLIRNFIAIEMIAFLFYFLATGHGSYKSEIYGKLFFSDVISYEIAKLLFLAGAQLCITIYAFLNWYYEFYEIRPNVISHKWGVFFKKNKILPLKKSMTVTFPSGFLGRLFHNESIHFLDHHGRSILLTAISHPKNYLEAIKKCVNPDTEEFAEKPNINQLIAQEEHEQLEFKSSLRFDHKIGKPNRELEKAAMKTVAAFLNSKGGYLVIGVNNERQPLGLENDFQTLQIKNIDGFENHFTQIFNAMIGPEFRHLIKIWFHNFEYKDVCVAQVLQSPRPAYLKSDNSEHFYIRTGNISTSLKLSEIESYSKSHWLKNV